MIYDPVPEDFNALFEVVGCVCEVNGEILLLQRNDGKSEGGKWGAPGGKIDPGETLTQAMVREMREETGYDVAAETLRYVKKFHVEHPRHRIIYHLFFASFPSKPEVRLDPNEHQDVAWVTPGAMLTMNYVTDFDECVRAIYAI